MIHQYKLNGYNIVLDTYSGSVHVTDEVAYDAIAMLDQGRTREEIASRLLARYREQGLSQADVDDTFADIDELIGSGKLFSEDVFASACGACSADRTEDCPDCAPEERTGDGTFAAQPGGAKDRPTGEESAPRPHSAEDLPQEPSGRAGVLQPGRRLDLKSRPNIVKALCLLVTHSCNLCCSYCFASQGNFHGREGLMSFETGKRALDFLVENSGQRRNLEVDFFGGEPLMNFEVCQQLVAYARSIEKEKNKNFRFTLTTNGVGINDEVIDWANRECHNVVLSLDGRREVNDRFRVDRAGRGSYDTIVPKFQEFVRRRGGRGYYMRGTFTHYNPDFTNDLFHMADDLGFTELSMEPVVCDPSSPSALTGEDLPILFEQYELLAKDMVRREREGKPITFYHYMINLEHGPCIYKRISGCGTGTEYMAVTAWGDLYPCHQFVSDPAYKLGNIWDGVTNTALRDSFKECNVYSHRDCDLCWAKLYCSGGCAANAYHATGDIHGTYEYGCRIFRKRIECAIMIQAARAIRQEK